MGTKAQQEATDEVAPKPPSSSEQTSASQENQHHKETSEKDEAQDYEDAVNYVKSFHPVITLLSSNNKGYPLAYRCNLCKSRNQPEGKVGSLVKPTLKSVKFYLKQHLECTYHKRKQKLAEEPDQCQVDVPRPVPERVLPCRGLCIGSEAQQTNLSGYSEEFKLWLRFSRLESTAKHKYWSDLSNGQDFVRHFKCSETPVAVKGDEEPVCQDCLSLGQSRQIVKRIVRFVTKYHAARYLRSRMFGTDEEAKAIIEEIEATTFGKRRQETLRKMKSLSVLELQQFVRSTYQTTVKDTMTQPMQDFVASHVAPCLKVNASSVSEELPALSSKLVCALHKGKLTELQELNVKIASAAVTGKLDANPFVQGLLVSVLTQLEKSERGIEVLTGRKQSSMTGTELSLLSEAGLQLSIAGCNARMARKFGQSPAALKIDLDQLPRLSLPLPALALLNKEHLDANLELIDQLFPRMPEACSRRLILGLDHTYLQRTLKQLHLRGKVGLVGRSWSPLGEDHSFMDLENLPADFSKAPRAQLMLQALLWDPNSEKRRTFSCAEMPMSQTASGRSENYKGNWESCAVFQKFYLYIRVCFLVPELGRVFHFFYFYGPFNLIALV